jgi:SH3-like domain-containing protein
VLSALVLLASGGTLLRDRSDLDRAIVVADATPVRVAPADTADVSFRLKPGSRVRAGTRYDDFVRVRTDGGRSGWVSESQVVKIVTRTRDYGPLPADLLPGPAPVSG